MKSKLQKGQNVIKTKEESKELILMLFAFGAGQNVCSTADSEWRAKPNQNICPNQYLLRILKEALDKNERERITIITQPDIPYLHCHLWIEALNKNKKRPPSTLKMLQVMVDYVNEKGADNIESIIIFSAPPHEDRIKNDLFKISNFGTDWFWKKTKFNPASLIKVTERPTYFSYEKYFCKNSSQWWTRTKWQWKLRELLISWLPWSVYKWFSR